MAMMKVKSEQVLGRGQSTGRSAMGVAGCRLSGFFLCCMFAIAGCGDARELGVSAAKEPDWSITYMGTVGHGEPISLTINSRGISTLRLLGVRDEPPETRMLDAAAIRNLREVVDAVSRNARSGSYFVTKQFAGSVFIVRRGEIETHFLFSEHEHEKAPQWLTVFIDSVWSAMDSIQTRTGVEAK